MPRHDSNRLESLSLRPDSDSAVEMVLRDYPFAPRTYAAVDGLISLRQRLQATEQWAARITLNVPAKLMTAALLEPPMLAGVFEELVEACGRAAPRRANAPKLTTAEDWHDVKSPEARAERLLYCLELLGEYVTGNWSYVACAPITDGSQEEDWELDYSPPAMEVEMLVRSLQPEGEPDRQRMNADDAADLAYNKLRRLLMSSIEDLQEKLADGIAGLTSSDVSASLASQDGDVLRVHEELIALLEQMRVATQPDAESRGSWWSTAGRQLQDVVEKWLEEVPGRLAIDRHARQQLKRDAQAAFGSVLQYSQLMRGNHASYELVRMIDNLQWICKILRRCIEELTPLADWRAPTEAFSQMIALTCCRKLVPQEVEQYWRESLGGDARLAGALTRQIVGARGQARSLQLEAVRQAARAAVGTLGEQTAKEIREAVPRILDRMQRLGLAMRLPSDAFRSVGMSPRTGPRRRLHDGRSWWLNPLTVVLADDER